MKKTNLFGAENGTRTRHLQLGRLSLYRMSYFRIKKNKWERKDSNLRRLSQQIYSLSHLTALELSHVVSRLCLEPIVGLEPTTG